MKGVIRYPRANSLWAHMLNVQSQSVAGAYSQMQTLVLCDLKLGWQMTRFSMEDTVPAKYFPDSSCHLVALWDIFLFFPFCSTTIHCSSSTFPESVTSKNSGKCFPQESPGWKHHIPKLQWFWPFHCTLERILNFPPSDIKKSWGGGQVFNIACHPWKLQGISRGVQQ